MREASCPCSICGVEADWVRVRVPNSEQMTYLCHRHYQSLRGRNPILAARYDEVNSLSHGEGELRYQYDLASGTG